MQIYRKIHPYTGFILAIFYGLFIRFLGSNQTFDDLYNIYSISFIWLTPIAIGIFPILFSTTNIYLSNLRLFFYPIISVFLFLITALITGLEDFICFFIIGIPFFLAAGILGLALGIWVKKRVQSKKLYTLIILPLIINPIENLIPNKSEQFAVANEVVINLPPKSIFPKLIDVPQLQDKEYKQGFYQLIGIPKPISSTSCFQDGKQIRIGKFSDGLKLYEIITELRESEFVKFEIDISKSQLRDKPTDQHILKSDYFKFENIDYTLDPMGINQTKLTLSCRYQIRSKMNSYANFWANQIIDDFEKRLLLALKIKLEKNN